MENLEFHNPYLLWLLLLIPLLALLKGRLGKDASITFSSIAIAKRVSGKVQRKAGNFIYFLRLLTLALFIIALARPQLGEGHSEVESSGIDIMLAVDVSGSMRALDFATNDEVATRLDIVKKTIKDFIEKRKTDRIGLIAFAKEPYLVSPLTLNHDWLLKNLERLHIGLIDQTATSIGAAIGMSSNRLRDLPAKSRIVILLTDGEDTVNTVPPVAAAEAAEAFGIKIYTIAAGETGRVPMPRLDANGQILRDPFGRVMLEGYAPSNIDEKTLREIATITHANFYRASNAKELSKIYENISKLEKTKVKLRHFATFKELFYIPLLIGFGLLAIELILANTRYRRLP